MKTTETMSIVEAQISENIMLRDLLDMEKEENSALVAQVEAFRAIYEKYKHLDRAIRLTDPKDLGASEASRFLAAIWNDICDVFTLTSKAAREREQKRDAVIDTTALANRLYVVMREEIGIEFESDKDVTLALLADELRDALRAAEGK